LDVFLEVFVTESSFQLLLIFSVVSAVLSLIVLIIVVVLILRRPEPNEPIEPIVVGVMGDLDKNLRNELSVQGRTNRTEITEGISRSSQILTQQLTQQIETLRQAVSDDAHKARSEASVSLEQVRKTLETKLSELQADNSAKLEVMRKTVDEKLHATLELRLGESFRLVSERLEQVHKGLGEMQALAGDVGDLKRVLSNVKTRGTWGEVQLGALLEQIFVPDQYASNVEVVSGSRERVEFAIRLPGSNVNPDIPMWLPIDAKFPREDYERLAAAQESADAVAAEIAAKALEARIRLEAKTIRQKYISPPATTDFAILFLPTEGLYAEVIRRPGLLDDLQRDFRVVLAGPTTLIAVLSSLQMGFRTLAIEKRSSEVWQLLGAVKTEFGKFGDMLAKTKKQLETAANTIGNAQSKSRTIERKLKGIESLGESATASLLGLEDDEIDDPQTPLDVGDSASG
jgi:DNA recombination protein RmuC